MMTSKCRRSIRRHFFRAFGGHSIYRRIGFAPTVLGNLAHNYFAGVRWLEKRAVAAAVDAVGRALILCLSKRHLLLGLSLDSQARADTTDCRKNCPSSIPV